MNNTEESIQKEISDNFALAALLSDLIEANVQAVAEEVMSRAHKNQQHLIDSVKVGSYEVWVQRICTLIPKKEVERLIEILK